ncbi:MAG: ABC transporter ATP-binding protein [Candidatus Binatia bacterium]
MLEVSGLSKTYRTAKDEVLAVESLTFQVKERDFVTLLGPSGCGKTTTLRCVAGLEVPVKGEISIAGEAVFSEPRRINVPVEKRDIGIVFQSYAIWPHMSVFENVAFPLKSGKRMPRQEIQKRVRDALRRVRMEELMFRPAPQLSGGQQQRVALARALVKRPKLLLLDEPLSNLDAVLRDEMRVEIKELCKELEITVLYVTHDQVEALAMSDRILVMRNGKVLQEGAPMEIYHRPENQFVASFIGAANLLEGKVETLYGQLATVETHHGKISCVLSKGLSLGSKVLVSVRPEEIIVLRDAPPDRQNTLAGKVSSLSFLGESLDCRVLVNSQKIRCRLRSGDEFREGDEVFIQLPAEKTLAVSWN